MSVKNDNSAKLRAHTARLETIANQEGELDVAEATRQITETLTDLYGRAVNEVDAAETTANAGDVRDYSEWLAAQDQGEDRGTTTNAGSDGDQGAPTYMGTGWTPGDRLRNVPIDQ